MKKANLISALVGMIVSAAAFAYTFTFKEFKNVPVGPEFFPRALAVCLFVCCLILFLTNLKSTSSNKGEAPTLSPLNKDMQRALLGLAIIVVYALLWNVTGFIITTPFAIFAMTRLLGKKEYLKMAIVSVVATAVIFIVFKFILGIEMPLGFIENYL